MKIHKRLKCHKVFKLDSDKGNLRGLKSKNRSINPLNGF